MVIQFLIISVFEYVSWIIFNIVFHFLKKETTKWEFLMILFPFIHFYNKFGTLITSLSFETAAQTESESLKFLILSFHFFLKEKWIILIKKLF